MDYEVILKDANSFGIASYQDVLSFISSLLTPLAPILRVLLTEDDLVILDGVYLSAGDGYDRFLIPLLEVFGIDGIISKAELAAQTVTTNNEGKKVYDNAKFTNIIVKYIDKLIKKVVKNPVGTIVDLLPQLVFFVYSDGLAQAVEQLIAPLTSLVDLVNDVTAKKVEAGGKTYVALDIYKMLLKTINEKVMVPNEIPEVTDIKGFIDTFLTAGGLETLISKILAKNSLDLGIEINGLFKDIVAKTCKITDVETKRVFTATEKNGKNYVTGVVANRADTLIQIISETLLGGKTLETILKSVAPDLDLSEGSTVKTILDAVTGENRYVILRVLLTYFNNYDVNTMVLEYLSFDKVEYAYDTFMDGSLLTQRKLRRSIKKLDKSLLTLIPQLAPMLEENATFKALLDKVGGDISHMSVKEFVHELLEEYALNDKMMTTIMGALIGLLGGEELEGTLSTVLPLVKQIIDVDLTPMAFIAKATSTSATLGAVLQAAYDDAMAKAEAGNGKDYVYETQYKYTYNDGTDDVEYWSTAKDEKTVKVGETEYTITAVMGEGDKANVQVTRQEKVKNEDGTDKTTDHVVSWAEIAKFYKTFKYVTYTVTETKSKDEAGNEVVSYTYTPEYKYSATDLADAATGTFTEDGKTWYGYDVTDDELAQMLVY